MNKLVEIGASDFNNCYFKKFLGKGHEITLFEPNEVLYQDLSKNLNDIENITIYNKAIGHSCGMVDFFNLGYASWIDGTPSFVATQVGFDNERVEIEKDYFMLKSKVDMVPITEVDKGDIDYLSMNCNGSELLVLSKLVSRPKIIRTCIYGHNHIQWAYNKKLIETLANMGYNLVVKDKSPLDTYFEIEFIK